MPRRESEEEIQRVHLYLYKSDIEWMKEHYGGQDQLGFSKIARGIIRSVIGQMRAKAEAGQRPVASGISEKMILEILDKEED